MATTIRKGPVAAVGASAITDANLLPSRIRGCSAAGSGTFQRVLTSDLPRVVSGVAIETVWAAAHLAMYPVGLVSETAARAAATVSPG